MQLFNREDNKLPSVFYRIKNNTNYSKTPIYRAPILPQIQVVVIQVRTIFKSSSLVPGLSL